MAELGKVKRVIEKGAPLAEVLLVIDGTTGQNGLAQAKIFSEAVEVTGLIVTKLDGSARGGVAEGEVGVNVLAISFFFSMLDHLSGCNGSSFVA